MSNIGNREREAKGVKGREEICDSKYDPTLTVEDKGKWEVAVSMSIKKTSKKSKERFFGLVWSEPFVMGMRAEGIVIAVNVVKNG